MKINLNVPEENWNLVSEVGYPEDGEWCFVIYKVNDEYSFSVGGYSEREEQFYVNFGWGGSVLDEQSVHAWALFCDDSYLRVSEA